MRTYSMDELEIKRRCLQFKPAIDWCIWWHFHAPYVPGFLRRPPFTVLCFFLRCWVALRPRS